MTEITRRDFFRVLVPSWCTRRNLKLEAALVGVAIGAMVVSSIISKVGFVAILKLSGLTVAAVLVLWLVIELGVVLQSILDRAPRWIQAPVFVTCEFIPVALAAAGGAYLYAKWQRGEDLRGVWITLAVMFIHQVMAKAREKV